MTDRPQREQLGEVTDRDRDYLQSIRTFEPPPPEFDPLQARERDLARYGYPRRPDSRAEQQLIRLWRNAFSRPHKFIRAEVEIDDVLSRRRHKLYQAEPEGEFALSGWGGLVCQTPNYNLPPPALADLVFATWTVPAIAPDLDNPTVPMQLAFWVGLDGFIVSDQVIQAGVLAQVTGTDIRYGAFAEWWTKKYEDKPIMIRNLPVRAGDRMSALVCAPQNGFAPVTLQNRTLGIYASIGLPKRPDITNDGMSAEWIVEGISPDLPDFGAIVFFECLGSASNHRLELEKGTETEIISSGNPLTKTELARPKDGPAWTIIVDWEGIR